MTNRLQNLPEVGLSLTFFIELLQYNFPEGLIDAFEIEPQIMCTRDRHNNLKFPKDIFEAIDKRKEKKLIHSIGAPIGGTRKPDLDQIDLINFTANQFNSPWVSEHLSFNATGNFNTSFFLPPFQTEEGVKVVSENINYLQKHLNRPLIIETGVNYFKPNFGELQDGEFVRRLCENTGCGILLDIHNLFANQLNGRESIDSFLNTIPLENVIEVHIAGGNEVNGLWLDSHSGNMDKRLLAITKEFLPDLTNLKALTYEVFDAYLPKIGETGLIKELEKTKALWENRTVNYTVKEDEKMPKSVVRVQNLNQIKSYNEWEDVLAHYVTDRQENDYNLKLNIKQQDDRIALYKSLIKKFRGSMLIGKLNLTMRYFGLRFGKATLLSTFEEFWKSTPPEQLIHYEVKNFNAFLLDKKIDDKWLYRLLNYEIDIQESFVESKEMTYHFDVNPIDMFNALNEFKLPENIDLEPKEDVEVLLNPEDNYWGSVEHYPATEDDVISKVVDELH